MDRHDRPGQRQHSSDMAQRVFSSSSGGSLLLLRPALVYDTPDSRDHVALSRSTGEPPMPEPQDITPSSDTQPPEGQTHDAAVTLPARLLTPQGVTPAEGQSGAGPCPQTIAGYELLEELGRGGMGVVCKARQKGLGRLVALKMILHSDHASEEQRRRFFNEAEALARLRHENIVQIHEIGEHDGKPFFSLEYIEGSSLDKRLGGTPLPPREAAQLMRQLADAMQAAHSCSCSGRRMRPCRHCEPSCSIRTSTGSCHLRRYNP